MKKKIVLSGIATVAVLSLVGCGGGSSDTTVATGKSFYLDSAVSGINYKCGTQEGITDAEGAFTFDVGSSCTFYLGDIQLRDIAADVLKDGESIVEDDAKIAQLLQTLDEDGDPTNGITVSPEVVDAMSTALNANGGNGTLPDTEEELNALSAELETEVPDYEGHAVTEAEAEEHLSTTQASVDTKKLKTFFAGKTLYNINEQDSIEAVIFNNDATTIQFGTEQAVDITFGAHEIVDKDGDHFIDEITDTYVKGHDSHGEFIFYVTEADAQAALDTQGNGGAVTNKNYTVYGGNTDFSGGFSSMPSSYVLLGKSNVTSTFTGTYKYYVIANENNNYTTYVDALKGSDNNYYSTNTTSNTMTSTGDTWQNLTGAPDNKYVSIGAHGYILIDASQTSLSSIEVVVK